MFLKCVKFDSTSLQNVIVNVFYSICNFWTAKDFRSINTTLNVILIKLGSKAEV